MEEHPAVDDRLAARPAELREQLGGRLGEHDVRAEVRQVAGGRRPSRERRVGCQDDLPRAQAAAGSLELVRRAGAHRRHARPLVQRHAGFERRPAQRAHEQPRMDGRALGKEDSAAEDRRRDAACQFVRSEGDRLILATEARGSGHRLLDAGVLRGRSRHLEHPGLAEPDVLAATLGPRPDPRDDLLPRPCELECPLPAEQRQDGRERRPVAVDEASVAAARPVPADLRLKQRHAQLGRALTQRERGPEPRVAAADDRHVRRRVDGESGRRRRIALRRQRLLEPPRG